MKSKFLDSLLAAVSSKDEASMKAALVKVLDEAREEEETKRKEEEETKDKARDASIAKLVTDCVAAAFKARDEKEAEERKKAEDEEAERKKAEDAERTKEEDENLEEELEEESGTKDARKAKDSALLVDSFENVKMAAEILAPGVSIPTLDASASPTKTFRDCHCSLRRNALRTALSDAATAEFITAVRGRALDAAEIDALTPGQARAIFNGAAALKRSANNSAATRDGSRAAAVDASTTDQKTPTQRFVDQAAERRKKRFQ
jgi:uncharacterized protein